MGFLMGAYGKLMTGKLVRDIQFQMIGIQSRLRRVTREIADKTKMYEAQERNMTNAINMQMRQSIYGLQCGLGIPGYNPAAGGAGINQYGANLAQMAATGCLNFNSMDNNSKWAYYSSCQQAIQMNYAIAQNMWKDTFEMQKTADLQALKDLEDSLQLEKDNLESRLKIAQQEYEAYKQEEKADAKGLVPEYTSQG